MKNDYLEKEVLINPRQPIWKLVFWIIFFLSIFNVAFYFYLQSHNPNLGYIINGKKWDMLKNLDEKKDWLILGDSTCNQGLSPSVLEDELNSSAINLCTIGNMLVTGDSWLLEQYIKRFGPPKNVLIIHTYDIWSRDKVELSLVSQLPVLSLIREKPKLWVFNKKEEFTLILYKYLPLYSQKSSLLETIVGAFQKKDHRHQTSFNEKGFMSMEYANPEDVINSRNGHKEFLKNNSFSMSPINQAGLDNIMEMSEKYNFNVFIATGPINSELSRDENFVKYITSINSFFSNYAGKNRRMHYIENIYDFPDKEMVSVDHIIERAAQTCSEKITQDIKKVRLLPGN